MAAWAWWVAGAAALLGGGGLILYEAKKSKTASTPSPSPSGGGPTPPPAPSGKWQRLAPAGTPAVYQVAPGATFAISVPQTNPMAQDLVGVIQTENAASDPSNRSLTITEASVPGQSNPKDWPTDDAYGAAAYRIEAKTNPAITSPMTFGATVGTVSSYSMWQWVLA